MGKKTNRYGLFVIFVILAVSVTFFYSFYTQHAWEDFFITFRHSKNLVDGNGLVYQLGERVHGFTSPLGVLIPALCYLITGKQSYFQALWLFRIISMLFFVLGGIFLLSSLADNNKPKKLPLIFLGLLYIFETKSVVFSMNGMETAFMLFFLAGFISLINKGLQENWVMAGICWAGLMWTRPDSFIYIFAFSFALLVFSVGSRKVILTAFLKTACICLLIYLPWVFWAWSYYGSPIPHTILAKLHLQGQMTSLSVFEFLFGPVYFQIGPWGEWLYPVYYFAGFFASFYWLVPLKDRLGKVASLTFFFLYFYLLMIPASPWYFPPMAMLGLFVLVNGLFKLAESTMERSGMQRNKTIAVFLVSLMSLGSIYIFTMTTLQMRIRQKEVENGNRKQVGLWLKEHSKRGERIYLECLGYIGYFSEGKILDYPGLVSVEVEQLLRKNKKLDFYSLLPEIKPEWVVLRPWEAENMKTQAFFANNYTCVKTFSVIAKLSAYKFIPGYRYLQYDASFLIFQNKQERR